MPDEYTATLHLPQTSFAMRANLPNNEPITYAQWDEINLYTKIREARQGSPRFILHDGPPYANGDVHMGTALNKVLKDFIIRYYTMQGYDAPYIPGWDCHGLPIEHKVSSNLPHDGQYVTPTEVRARCREYAMRFVGSQRDQFRRLGVSGDWFKPYLTMQTSYEEKVIAALQEMMRRGYIYRGLKPVHWCTQCKTALAEAEVEYKDLTSPSIFVRFTLADEKPGVLGEVGGSGALNVIIWTTTPWTLPANLAVAVHPDYNYVVIPANGERLVVAEELWNTVANSTGLPTVAEPLARFKGRELEGIKLAHPFLERNVPIVLADYVTLDTGTGLVHTAPGHGADDYMTGQRYGLPAFAPVDVEGRLTEEAGVFVGEQVLAADPLIINLLKEKGKLLFADKAQHSYPTCWRCKSPVIFRATSQWFVSITHNNLREQALAAADRVQWIPASARERIKGMLLTRPDWCISRQRVWGIPIPAFHCEKCDESYMTVESIEIFRKLVESEGSDSWTLHPNEDLLPKDARCKCGSTQFRKGTDILDVWFESGCSHLGVLKTRPELSWPADLYLEGSDQHRGWFQVSMLIGLTAAESEPYRAVLTHGFILDAQGKAMHKSTGNAISPQDVVKKYGADVIRLWSASVNYHVDIPFGFETMDRVSEAYRRIRNTFRFMLGSIEGINMPKPPAQISDYHTLDRWILGRYAELLKKVEEAYKTYEFHVIYQAVHNFCAIDLSALYLDTAKDRLYTYAEKDPERISAITTLGILTSGMARMLAPLLVYTSEEVWKLLPASLQTAESVHLAEFPKAEADWTNPALATDFERLLAIREDASKALEVARAAKLIGHPLDASIKITALVADITLLRKYESILRTLFIVSELQLAEGSELSTQVEVNNGQKCPRCWIRYSSLGEDSAHPGVCARCAAALTADGC